MSSSQMEKYEEVVKCKDNHIKDLENKIKELQTTPDNAGSDNAGYVLLHNIVFMKRSRSLVTIVCASVFSATFKSS